MWWVDLAALGERCAQDRDAAGIHSMAIVEVGAILDEQLGPISIGEGSRICRGAIVRGPVTIGAECLVGNLAVVRGPSLIGNAVRIGYAAEIKHALIGDRVSIGPQCFVGDSKLDDDVYLGAQVRTSNHRLDGAEIKVRDGDREVATGRDKLGCWIGAGAALGIQVIVLPGRVIAPGSLFEPRITISRNYPAGHYRAKQSLERV